MGLIELAGLLIGASLILLCVYWFLEDLTRPLICTYDYDRYCEIWAHQHHAHEVLREQILWWLVVVLLSLPFLIG